MWIFCAGMARSASTLQYQIASHLVEGAGLGSRVPWTSADEFPSLRAAANGSREWRVFKCHECPPEIAKELREGDARALCTYRDLRDVIASQMLFLGTSFDRVWSAGFLQDCVERHFAWTATPRVAMTRYESIVADPAAHVRQIAAHLDIPVTDGEAAVLAAEYSIERQRKRIAGGAATETVDSADGALRFHPHTLLHHNHINSGRPGAWKEILTSEEQRRVEETFADWLVDHGYPVG
jgi:Sulfotransferase domain